MLAVDRDSQSQKTSLPVARISKPLGQLSLAKVSKRLVVFNPAMSTLHGILYKASRAIKGLARTCDVQRVVAHNPDCLWAISRRSRNSTKELCSEGFVAFLMLNAAGFERLLNHTFDTSVPDLELLVAQNEKPAAIYVWALYAPGMIAGGIPLVFEKISSPLYKDVTLYARPVTDSGRRFLKTIGFVPEHSKEGSDIYTFSRGARIPANPIYDTYHPGGVPKSVSVTVAHSLDDILRIMSVRSAVFIGTQRCPYEEEFDGNDFAATHLLGYVGSEPAGCLRLRFFASFVKIERLAVRNEFRKSHLAFELVRAGIELGRVKGYRKFYGHAQKRLANFWGRFGFQPLKNGSEFAFSDFDYIEMVMETVQHPQAVDIGSDPYRIIRPEGRWHAPSVLERSAVRPVTRPSLE